MKVFSRIPDIGIWQGPRRARFYCGPCENSDMEMGLSRRRPVGGLRLRGATDDGPPPLLPSTRRGLYGWPPGHSDRAGKGMRPQVGEHCVKDTTEEIIRLAVWAHPCLHFDVHLQSAAHHDSLAAEGVDLAGEYPQWGLQITHPRTFHIHNPSDANWAFRENGMFPWQPLLKSKNTNGITRILHLEGPGHMQDPIVCTLMQNWTKNPCLAAGLRQCSTACSFSWDRPSMSFQVLLFVF